jgi:hypothetical protein
MQSEDWPIFEGLLTLRLSQDAIVTATDEKISVGECSGDDIFNLLE